MVRVAQGSEGDGRDGRDDGRVGRSGTKGSEPARTGRRRDGLNGGAGFVLGAWGKGLSFTSVGLLPIIRVREKELQT